MQLTTVSHPSLTILIRVFQTQMRLPPCRCSRPAGLFIFIRKCSRLTFLRPRNGFRRCFNRLAAGIICLTKSYSKAITNETYHHESNAAPFTPVLDERSGFEPAFWCRRRGSNPQRSVEPRILSPLPIPIRPPRHLCGLGFPAATHPASLGLSFRHHLFVSPCTSATYFDGIKLLDTGAGGHLLSAPSGPLPGDRTRTPKHWYLRPACLPIPPGGVVVALSGFEPERHRHMNLNHGCLPIPP